MGSYIRRLYDWVLGWSNTKYGVSALFILSLSESSFFPIPPDVLLIALALGMQSKALYFALICSVASILGAIIGYSIGYFTWWNSLGEYSTVAIFFFNNIPGFSSELFTAIQQKFDLYNFFIVFTAGFTPIPFKIITISAGAFNINFPMFIFASTISRSARFFLVAILIRKYGRPITAFIDKYFNILSMVFTVLLIGGFLALKVLF
ncbi:MAG: YqaA family protein [Candidatus Neomarinimicrobiota bacterium]|tara:strand:+ start:1619 stop:2236 length:618 start_codon:yes stop_codon:yes gene_type:complete